MALPEPGSKLNGPLQKADQRALREAADWFAQFQAGDAGPEQQRQWRLWLEREDANARAWAWMERVSNTMSSLQEPAASNILIQSRARRRVMGKTVASVLALGAGSAATISLLPVRAWAATYYAGVGPGQRILLQDGSLLWLDTDSAANVDFTESLRTVELVRGRLFIQTAPDPAPLARRFEVVTPEGRLIPSGTRFAVRLAGSSTALAVFEGSVASHPRRAGPDDVLVVPAGMATRMSAASCSALRPASRAMQTWIDNVLLAEHIPLGEFIQELARYRHGWITCAPEVADLILFGSYPLDDIDASLSAIARTLPVQVEKRWPGRILIQARR